MKGKVSAEMLRARELLRAGHYAAEAARQVGLSRSAITKDAECKKIMAAQRAERSVVIPEELKMTESFVAAYMQMLASVIRRFPMSDNDSPAQAALWMIYRGEMAMATGPGLLEQMKSALSDTINTLRKFESNLGECRMVETLGEDVATPEKVIGILMKNLGLAPVQMQEKTEEDPDVVVGGFYETPNGAIARITGCNGRYEIVHYDLDGDHGRRFAKFSDFRAWVYRQDLRDFPNASDPRLPYEFDLHWDIKYLSELGPLLEDAGEKEAAEIRAAMQRHNIPEPK